eukprot:m.550498 g.550498  ORF g.550498 m.550498 type:complete len:282 (+) comp22162_c1_seq28:267-1112(+)
MASRVTQAKAKGRRFQQSIEHLVKDAFPHLTGNDIRSTNMSVSGDDLILSPRAQAILPYQFEIKCQEKISIWRAVHQLLKRQREDLTPCIVVAKNYAKPVAVVPFSHFCSISSQNRAAGAASLSAQGDCSVSEAFEKDPSTCLTHITRDMLTNTGYNSLVTTVSAKSYTALQCQQWNLRIWAKNYLNLWKIYDEHVRAVKKGLVTAAPLPSDAQPPSGHDTTLDLSNVTPAVVFGKPVADACLHHLPLVYVALPFASFLDLVVQQHGDDTSKATQSQHVST